MTNELLDGIDPIENLSNELDLILYNFRKTGDKKKLGEELKKIKGKIESLSKNSAYSKRIDKLKEKYRVIESELER